VDVKGFRRRLVDNKDPVKQNPPSPYGFWRIYAEYQMVEAAGIESEKMIFGVSDTIR